MLSLRFSQINVFFFFNPKLILLPPSSLKYFLIVLGSFYFIAALLKFYDCIYDKFIICLQTMGFQMFFRRTQRLFGQKAIQLLNTVH